MVPFSILDLSPITQGSNTSQALENSRRLAQEAEASGYKRFWLAEHHGMKGIASAATSIVISHVAAGTKTIRVGSGGIMLPNHSPLVIAEQFGTLAALYPGRIDLGLGRAPGTDMRTASALRRNMEASANNFPNDVVELQALLGPAGEDQALIAVPGADSNVPIWLLGSSHFSAHLAGMLGLPFAFASHFAPGDLDAALAIYRRDFKPSRQLDAPYAIAAFNIFAADSDVEAELLASSMQQSFVSMRTGTPRRLPPPVPGFRESLPPQLRTMLETVLEASSVGSPETVQRDVAAFLRRTQADELIVSCQMFDPEARKRSFTIVAQVRDALAEEARAVA